MSRLLAILTLFLAAPADLVQVEIAETPCFAQPEQIHLSYAGHPSQMWVTWITFDAIDQKYPAVEYGSGPEFLDQIAYGETDLFHVQPGIRIIYVHRVLLDKLIPGRTYLYHVGSVSGWSNIFFFRALKPQSAGYRFVVFGDLGNWNAQSLSRLQQEAQRGHFDMVLHVGDFAYDLDKDVGKVGDQFMRQIEPIAAYIPYMTVPGNHESAANFSHYTNRFTMPGTSNSLFYSFDLGQAHIIGFSTELYFYLNYGTKQIQNQFEWLKNDLIKANQNRVNVPWIITMAHRPMYCSNADSDDCTIYESIIRTGGVAFKKFALEDLFYEQGVDLAIWAHEHSYERLWPIYNRTVYNGTKDPYYDPPAPVHVITGSAGCQEKVDSFVPRHPPWSAYRSSDYGYARMLIRNSTHLYFEQYSDNESKVIDSFWLTKHHHGPYSKEKLIGGLYVPYNYVVPHEKKCEDCHEMKK